MQRYYQSLSEKDRRRYAGIEALKLGHGGIAYVSRVLGCDYRTIKSGMAELQDDECLEESGIRRGGGGRKSAFAVIENLDAVFLRVMEHHTAGSPVDETVRWTNLNRGVRRCRKFKKIIGPEISVLPECNKAFYIEIPKVACTSLKVTIAPLVGVDSKRQSKCLALNQPSI